MFGSTSCYKSAKFPWKIPLGHLLVARLRISNEARNPTAWGDPPHLQGGTRRSRQDVSIREPRSNEMMDGQAEKEDHGLWALEGPAIWAALGPKEGLHGSPQVELPSSGSIRKGGVHGEATCRLAALEKRVQGKKNYSWQPQSFFQTYF